MLIAASNFYTDVLFAVLRAFARCKEVVAPAWALLLRVPTHVGRLQALQRPEAVDWRAEVDVLERQPMRALYTMQVVCAKLLPVEVPHDSYGAAVQQMASWKARFMAHGFVTLEPETEIVYKCSDFYAPECDGAVRWNDPDIGIDWPATDGAPVLSPKDEGAPLLAEFDSPFTWEGAT